MENLENKLQTNKSSGAQTLDLTTRGMDGQEKQRALGALGGWVTARE